MMKPLQSAKRALELDPLAARAHADVGYALYFARRYDEAIEQFKKTIDMDPKFAPRTRASALLICKRGCMKRPSWSWKRLGL